MEDKIPEEQRELEQEANDLKANVSRLTLRRITLNL
jgi:hypothetical protein